MIVSNCAQFTIHIFDIFQNHIVSTWNLNLNIASGPSEETMYEEDIANDMKELELRWKEELEEQEKRWSSEDDSNK